MRLWHFPVIVLSVLCAGFSVWGSRELYESTLGYTWPHVSGKVVSSIARSALVHGKSGEFTSNWPDIQYEYWVGNTRFVNDRIRFTLRGRDQEETKFLVSSYPVGKSVFVYFSPDDPRISVLELGIWWPLIPLLILAMVLSWGTLMHVIVDVKQRQKP